MFVALLWFKFWITEIILSLCNWFYYLSKLILIMSLYFCEKKSLQCVAKKIHNSSSATAIILLWIPVEDIDGVTLYIRAIEHVQVYGCVFICVCMCVLIHMLTGVYLFVCACVCSYICACLCACANMKKTYCSNACVHTYAHVFVLVLIWRKHTVVMRLAAVFHQVSVFHYWYPNLQQVESVSIPTIN